MDQAKVNKENLFEALEQANLNNFVKKLPFKENTIIGEEGTSISGGEKQRIALARSLYLRKKIIFLDEPTSSLDEVNEKKIIDILLSLKNTTIVMVTHKKDNILKFDKVINLDKKN